MLFASLSQGIFLLIKYDDTSESVKIKFKNNCDNDFRFLNLFYAYYIMVMVGPDAVSVEKHCFIIVVSTLGIDSYTRHQTTQQSLLVMWYFSKWQIVDVDASARLAHHYLYVLFNYWYCCTMYTFLHMNVIANITYTLADGFTGL